MPDNQTTGELGIGDGSPFGWQSSGGAVGMLGYSDELVGMGALGRKVIKAAKRKAAARASVKVAAKQKQAVTVGPITNKVVVKRGPGGGGKPQRIVVKVNPHLENIIGDRYGAAANSTAPAAPAAPAAAPAAIVAAAPAASLPVYEAMPVSDPRMYAAAPADRYVDSVADDGSVVDDGSVLPDGSWADDGAGDFFDGPGGFDDPAAGEIPDDFGNGEAGDGPYVGDESFAGLGGGFFSKIGKVLKSVASVALPIAAPVIGSAVTGIMGALEKSSKVSNIQAAQSPTGPGILADIDGVGKALFDGLGRVIGREIGGQIQAIAPQQVIPVPAGSRHPSGRAFTAHELRVIAKKGGLTAASLFSQAAPVQGPKSITPGAPALMPGQRSTVARASGSALPLLLIGGAALLAMKGKR